MDVMARMDHVVGLYISVLGSVVESVDVSSGRAVSIMLLLLLLLLDSDDIMDDWRSRWRAVFVVDVAAVLDGSDIRERL